MIEVSCFGGEENPLLTTYIDRLEKTKNFRWNKIKLKKIPSERPSNLLPEELDFLKKNPHFIALDVSGRQMNSEEFADWLFRGGSKHLVIGPAPGLHPEMKEKAKELISVSSLTLTHLLAQITLAESLYRAVCSRNNHPFAK